MAQGDILFFIIGLSLWGLFFTHIFVKVFHLCVLIPAHAHVTQTSQITKPCVELVILFFCQGWCVWVETGCSVKSCTGWLPGPKMTTELTRTNQMLSWCHVLYG